MCHHPAVWGWRGSRVAEGLLEAVFLTAASFVQHPAAGGKRNGCAWKLCWLHVFQSVFLAVHHACENSATASVWNRSPEHSCWARAHAAMLSHAAGPQLFFCEMQQLLLKKRSAEGGTPWEACKQAPADGPCALPLLQLALPDWRLFAACNTSMIFSTEHEYHSIVVILCPSQDAKHFGFGKGLASTLRLSHSHTSAGHL